MRASLLAAIAAGAVSVGGCNALFDIEDAHVIDLAAGDAGAAGSSAGASGAGGELGGMYGGSGGVSGAAGATSSGGEPGASGQGGVAGSGDTGGASGQAGASGSGGAGGMSGSSGQGGTSACTGSLGDPTGVAGKTIHVTVSLCGTTAESMVHLSVAAHPGDDPAAMPSPSEVAMNTNVAGFPVTVTLGGLAADTYAVDAFLDYPPYNDPMSPGAEDVMATPVFGAVVSDALGADVELAAVAP